MATCSLLSLTNGASPPSKLPTIEEIESATEVLADSSGSKVVGVGDHFVVKYGPQVEQVEGETQLFLAQSTKIPVPRVYAIYQNPDKRNRYIIMERIRGSTLDSEWPSMDQAAKEAVSLQLRRIFEEMRSLESPGGYCSIGRGGMPDGLFWTNDPRRPYAGPFETESSLNIAMVAKYVEYGLPKHKADYYSRTFEELFQNHGPVFSHADFQRKNIMVRKDPVAGEKDAQHNLAEPELVLIDWEFAGWYPSYWEYARAMFACGRWDDDWSYWVDRTLKPHRMEYAWVEMLLREMWS